MPKASKWDNRTKALVVLEGLKGKPVADICQEHQLSQAEYYRWRDRFLSNMQRVFDDPSRKEALLNKQIDYLKKVVGDLTVELKKSDVEWLK